MRHLRFVALSLLAPAAPLLAQSGRAFTPNDWYRVTTLSAPDVSPDGRLVAFTVTTVNAAENKRHSEVWVVPTAGGEPVRYTSPSTESSNPRFSPDGSLLFFQSQRAGGKGNTWALRMDRPGGEAFQPTSYPPRGTATRDGRLFVFTDTIAPDTAGGRKDDLFAKMGAMARPPYGAITRPVDPARFDGRHIVDAGYKANGRGFIPGLREARAWRAQQIWVQRPGEERRRLTSTAYSHRDAAVSPDGRWIAFVADSGLRSDSAVQAARDSIAKLPYDARRDEAERNDSEIFVIPAAGCGASECEPRRVATIPGFESDLQWSPDGRQIAFTWRPARTKSVRLGVVDAAGGQPVNVIGDFVYEPEQFEWLPNGRMLMQAAVGGRTALHVVDPKARTVREIVGGRRRINGFSADDAGRVVAFVATSMTKPTELFVANADGTGERKLTGFNDKLNAEIAWSDAERFTYRSVGGLEIEGWLMKPYGYQAGKKYPLALYIHGGPHSAYG
ncbi:MAG: S9 family peptidase, partial [Gemmatimonadaceae bacterium]